MGDNLAVLRLLARDHAGGVQVIYIDPPYNTGKTEFTYNDRFRREGADPRDRRHAEWLSFIYPRLVLGAAWFGYGCYVYTARDVARRTTKRAAATDGQDRVRRRWAAVGVVCVAVLAVGVVWLAQPVHVELIDDCLHCYLPDL